MIENYADTAVDRQARIVAEAGDSADMIAEAFAMLNGTDRNRSLARPVADRVFTARGTRARVR